MILKIISNGVEVEVTLEDIEQRKRMAFQLLNDLDITIEHKENMVEK